MFNIVKKKYFILYLLNSVLQLPKNTIFIIWKLCLCKHSRKNESSSQRCAIIIYWCHWLPVLVFFALDCRLLLFLAVLVASRLRENPKCCWNSALTNVVVPSEEGKREFSDINVTGSHFKVTYTFLSYRHFYDT